MATKPKKAKTAKVERPSFEEVGAIGAGTASTALFSDSSMEATAGNIREWRRMLRDGQVQSTWQQRQLFVLAKPWTVEPGADDQASLDAAEFMREQLNKVRFDNVFQKMHYGFFYGFSAAECLYAPEGNRVVLTGFKVRKRERFRFDHKTGELKFISGANPQGESLLPNKFWVFTAPGDDDDTPHGPPIGWLLYWPLFLKENGARFWAVALEKFGMPTAAGHFPPGASKKEQELLLETLLAIHGSAAVTFPEGFEAKLLESVRSSGGDYERFQAYWDRMVSKIILSQTMTTDDGSSKSQAVVHSEVRDAVVQADSDLLCESFNNGPVTWLTRWNFPTAVPPLVYRASKKSEDLNRRAERDKIVFETTGLRPTQDTVEDVYGGSWERAPTAQPAPQEPPPTFADPALGPDDVDALADQLDAVTEGAVGNLIAGIRDVLFRSATAEDAQRNLLAFAAEHGIEDLGALVGGGMAVADLMGRSEVS